MTNKVISHQAYTDKGVEQASGQLSDGDFY